VQLLTINGPCAPVLILICAQYRDGGASLRLHTGKDLWEYLRNHPTQQDLLQRVMTWMSQLILPHACSATLHARGNAGSGNLWYPCFQELINAFILE
jgi:hypothetical protein